MKTKYNHFYPTLLIPGGFFLALLFSDLPHLYAEDRETDRAIESRNRNTKTSEQPIESDNNHDTVSLVGPSGEEIHDFLYPTAENRHIATPLD
jgi:hypothetical protein